MRSLVSSAFVALSAVVLVAGTAFAAAYPWLPWSRLFNVPNGPVAREGAAAVAVFFGCYILTLLLGLTERVRSGLQQSYQNAAWSMLGSLGGLAGVFAAIRLEASLPWLVLAMAGAPLGATLVNGLVLARQQPWVVPRRRHVHRRSMRRLLNLSGLFLVVHIAGAAGYYSDYFVITQILGPEAVTQYAIPTRLFMLVPVLLGFALQPLWAAYAEALGRGDHEWIRATLGRSMRLSLMVAVPLITLLVLWGDVLVRWWVGSVASAPLLLRVGLGIWMLLSAIGGPIAMFLNGIGAMRFQAWSMSAMAVVNLALSIYLVNRIGVAGAVFGSATAQALCVLAPAAVYVKRSLSWLSEAPMRAGAPKS
jgi:O-antigen/teichoic acid export membrane protein